METELSPGNVFRYGRFRYYCSVPAYDDILFYA